MEFHLPVLVNDVVTLLKPSPGKIFIDATLGNGGHTLELLTRGATVYGLDLDPQNLKLAAVRINSLGLAANFKPIHANFSRLNNIFNQLIHTRIDGLLFDLGLSLNQQKAAGRGFSFNDSDSLDMRLDPSTQTLTAETVINTFSETDLYNIFSKISQEKYSRLLAQEIIRHRKQQPIRSAASLSQIIQNFYHQKHLLTKIHPATKIIMALRIFVNQEFQNLKIALDDSLKILPSNAIVTVISFHSGEDRIVKNFIRRHPVINLTTAPIRPSKTEVSQNPLSRSALLRAFALK